MPSVINELALVDYVPIVGSTYTIQNLALSTTRGRDSTLSAVVGLDSYLAAKFKTGRLRDHSKDPIKDNRVITLGLVY